MISYKIISFPMDLSEAASVLLSMNYSSSGSPIQVGDAVVVVTPKKLGKGGAKRKKGKGVNNGLRCTTNGARKNSKKGSSLNSSFKEILEEVVVPSPKGMTFNGERWVFSSRPSRSASSSAFAKIVAGSLNKGARNV